MSEGVSLFSRIFKLRSPLLGPLHFGTWSAAFLNRASVYGV